METELITKLAEQLGTTTEYLWGVMIGSYPYLIASDIACMLIFGAIFIIALRYSLKAFDELDELDKLDELDGWSFEKTKAVRNISVTIMIIGGLGVLWNIIGLCAHLLGLLNPEAAALKEIIKLIN